MNMEKRAQRKGTKCPDKALRENKQTNKNNNSKNSIEFILCWPYTAGHGACS